jgi:hypothetical protein
MEGRTGKPRRRLLWQVLGALFVAYLTTCSFFFWAMHQPPSTLGRIVDRTPKLVLFLLIPFIPMWNLAQAGDLEPGDLAPPFELQREQGEEKVRLEDYRGRQPVVLVFGSYT